MKGIDRRVARPIVFRRARIVLAGVAVAASLTAAAVPTIAPAARTACAANTSSDLYVVATARGSATGTPDCPFRSITQALQAAADRELGSSTRIVLAGGTSSEPAVFGRESFPLAVPAGATITTADDPAVGGSGLDASHYVVSFASRRATHAALTAGGRLAGFTLRSDRAPAATDLLICGEGTTSLDHLQLEPADGADLLARGLVLQSGCDLTADSLSVHDFTGDGVVAAQGSSLTLTRASILDNGGRGIALHGLGAISDSDIGRNGDDGLLVQDSPRVILLANQLRENGGSGLELHPTDITFRGNRVYMNGGATTGTAPNTDPQIFVTGAPLAGTTVETPTGTATAYDLRGSTSEVCDGADRNSIFGYNIVDAGLISVGIRAEDGAVVDARWNEWASSSASQNVTAGAGSFVVAEPSCGTRGFPAG